MPFSPLPGAAERCCTNEGSDSSSCCIPSSVAPFEPCTEVYVPHSWTVSPCGAEVPPGVGSARLQPATKTSKAIVRRIEDLPLPAPTLLPPIHAVQSHFVIPSHKLYAWIWI